MVHIARTAVVFGKGRVAIHATRVLVNLGYDVSFVVPSTHDLPGDIDFAAWAASQGIGVRRQNLDHLDLGDVDLGISTYYDRIFRQRHIDRFGLLVNVHNSLLPRNRGVRPVNWALRTGDRRHGVTLHVITPGIDEGAIIDQEVFNIDPDVDEVRDVYERCLSAAEVLLGRALPLIWDLPRIQQDETRATYHSAAEEADLGDRRFLVRGDIGMTPLDTTADE